MTNEEYPNPLTYEKIKTLPSKPAKVKASKAILNIKTFRVPKGAKASLVKVKGSVNTFNLQIQYPIEGTIELSKPFERISAESPNISKLGRKLRTYQDSMRPPNMRLDYLPRKLEVKRNEVIQPPLANKHTKRLNRADISDTIFGPDNRIAFKPNSYPWTTIGRVDGGGFSTGFATGCLVGPRHLLTSNHTIQWKPDGSFGPVRFQAGYFNGNHLGEAWATKVLYPGMKVIGALTQDGEHLLTDVDSAFDYVVCILNTRLGEPPFNLSWVNTMTYSSSWNGGNYWTHVGYPLLKTLGQEPTFQSGATISTVQAFNNAGWNGYVLGNFNDTGIGHSGGPYLGWWPSGPAVVGVHSASSLNPQMNTSGDNEAAGGPAMSYLISYARSKYP